MKKNETTVLVIGKLVQLGQTFKVEIVASLLKANLIEEKTQVTILANNLSIPNLAKEIEKMNATHVCFIGLKSHTVPEYIGLFERTAKKELTYLVVSPEGPVVPFSFNSSVLIYGKLSELSEDDFSKQKAA